jgi:hypothetical protein
MSKLSFDDDQVVRRQRPSGTSGYSSMDRFITRITFGLVRSKKDILYTQIGVITVAVIVLIWSQISTGQSTIENPSEELINSPQPNQPL